MRKATRAQNELTMRRPSCVFAVLMKQLHLGTEKKHLEICSVFFLSVSLLRNAQVRWNPAALVPLSVGGWLRGCWRDTWGVSLHPDIPGEGRCPESHKW